MWKDIKPRIGDMLVAINDIETRAEKAQKEAYQRGYEEGYKKCLSDSIEAIKELSILPSADMMRNYLIEYCTGRSCRNCPLNCVEFMCGRGHHFSSPSDDSGYIPDAELHKYYKKVKESE